MRLELKSEGRPVQFVIVNKDDAGDMQHKLIEKCSIPIFQDVSLPQGANAWRMHEGEKDDMYVFDREGKLAAVMPKSGPDSISTTSMLGRSSSTSIG